MIALLPLVIFLLLAVLCVLAFRPVSEDSDRWRAEVDRLRQRIRVLEAIVTDKDRQLREEIDRLR